MIRPRRRALLLATLGLIAAACAGDPDDGSADATIRARAAVTTTSAPATTAPPTTTTATSSATDTVEGTGGAEWVSSSVDEAGCECADGSEYWYHRLDRDPSKVLLYFQGGGACFNEETCSFTDGTYKVTTGSGDHPQADDGGIWDADNPHNPFADWSVVFVPYCSGDAFLGAAETVYGDDLLVRHNGAAHAQKGLDHVVERYPDLERLVVAGSSAGGAPVPRIAGLASDLLPDADIVALADASGAYPSDPTINETIGASWGATKSIPDWPILDGVDPSEVGISDLFTYAGLHDPSIRMARVDSAFDDVQAIFSSLAGLEGGTVEILDANEARIEAAGVPLDAYVAAGSEHTILPSDELYQLEVDGASFLDWLTTLVEGGSPGDVHCTECAG